MKQETLVKQSRHLVDSASLSALSRTKNGTSSDWWDALAQLVQVDISATETSLDQIKWELEERVHVIVCASVGRVEGGDECCIGAD
jgi:hypothetical protein